MTKKAPEPAVKGYFFGRAYRDLSDITKGAFNSNINSMTKLSQKIFNISNRQYGMLGTVFALFRAVFIVCVLFTFSIIGIVFPIATAALHGIFIGTISFILYILIGIVWCTDKLYLSWNKIFVACPKCKEKYSLPVYICDKCGSEHLNLVPGVYGIFKRRCKCGKKLPTSFWGSGRKKLRAKCPTCGHFLFSKESVPLCIPILGGPSVGKTCYITAVVNELVKEVCPASNLKLTYYDKRSQTECLQMVSRYAYGNLQVKTSDINPFSYNFFLSGKGLNPDRLLYFYDIAGEAFFTADALSSQKQYEYCHGFVFLIDPLSIPKLKNLYREKEDFNVHGVSVADINETFDSFLNNLKRISGLSSTELSNIPCAVVINKTDAYDLESLIGEQHARAIMDENPKQYKDISNAIDFLSKNFLLENGMSNFVNNIELCFKKNKYFSCSALGHPLNGQDFKPMRVFEPIKWIVSFTDKKLYSRISFTDKNQK